MMRITHGHYYFVVLACLMMPWTIAAAFDFGAIRPSAHEAVRNGTI